MLNQLLIIIPRTLLGYLFFAASIDGLSYVLRGKEVFKAPLSPAGIEFLHGLKKHRAIWGMKAIVDLIASLMLLLNFHAPLGLLLVLPAIAVIIVFQFSINKVGIPIGIALAVFTGALLVHYSNFYTPLLTIEDGRGPLASGHFGHPAATSD